MQHAINGVKLHWREKGAGDPVIFVHGFPFRSTMWGPQLEAVPEGWRYIAPDLRGFGESERGDMPLSIELFADDVVGLMDHLAIEQAVICGLSMGGYVTLSMAERYPHRLRAVVLVATRASADDDAAKAGRKKLAAQVRVEGSQPVVNAMLPKLMAGATSIQRPQVQQFVMNMMQTTAPETLGGSLAAMAERDDYRGMLEKIAVSTMVVGGDQDQIIPREEMDLLTRQVRGAKLEIIPNVGHLPNLEAPDVFNKLLENFLKFLPPPLSIGDLLSLTF